MPYTNGRSKAYTRYDMSPDHMKVACSHRHVLIQLYKMPLAHPHPIHRVIDRDIRE